MSNFLKHWLKVDSFLDPRKTEAPTHTADTNRIYATWNPAWVQLWVLNILRAKKLFSDIWSTPIGTVAWCFQMSGTFQMRVPYQHHRQMKQHEEFYRVGEEIKRRYTLPASCHPAWVTRPNIWGPSLFPGPSLVSCPSSHIRCSPW